MKELASITRSTSSVVDFFVVIIEMLFEFVCQFFKKASTCSFGRRVKRIEISKARPVTAAFVPFHKIGYRNIQVNVLTATFQEFQG